MRGIAGALGVRISTSMAPTLSGITRAAFVCANAAVDAKTMVQSSSDAFVGSNCFFILGVTIFKNVRREIFQAIQRSMRNAANFSVRANGPRELSPRLSEAMPWDIDTDV